MKRPAQSPQFQEITEELSRPLLHYLERYAGDRAVAEELLQETFIRVSRGLCSFEGRASLKTWAFSIATRVALDYFRQPAHRVHIVDMEETGELSSPDTTVDQKLVIDEMNACVRRVIDSLPEDYRAALVLHDIEGLTSAEIAEILRCSVATAKIRIHRARTRLKEALQQECEFYHDSHNVLRCDRKR